MKTILLFSFLSVTIILNGTNDKGIIEKIDNLNASALVFYNNKQIVKSYKQFLNAKSLSDSIQDNYRSAKANYNLGNIYYLMENYKSAQEHYQLTIDVLKPRVDSYLVPSSYLNLGKIFKYQNYHNLNKQHFEEAIKYSSIYEGLNTAEKEKIQNVAFEARINLCELYIQRNNLNKALYNLLQLGNDLQKNSINLKLEGYYEFVYGKYFQKKGLHNIASDKFGNAIAIFNRTTEEVDLTLMSNAYKQLSDALEKSGKLEEANLALLEHHIFEQKLINEDANRQDLIEKSQFLIEDYKNEAETANAERLQQLKIANQFKKINTIIFVILVLLFISFVIIIVAYRSKIKLSKTLKIKNLELEVAKEEAVMASELKSKFISNVSHELRTPLYGVVGISSLLLNEKKNLSESDEKYLKSLKYSGDYLLNLVNDILQVNEIETQNIQLKNISVNLNTLIQDIADSFYFRLKESNNRIKVYIDKEVPECVKADKIRLSQVLINLIGNSIKFTNKGIINLRLKVLSLEEEKVSLRFEVEDDGEGIPKDKFSTIFDNFAQLGDQNNTNYHGTGLGLPITKNIIELFKSKIELESEVGKGTKFSFNVDFKIDEENKLKTTKKKNIEPGDNYKILIAEDNKINQIVTKNLLVKNNYACDVVENGAEAVKKMKVDNYDLILMDINMPVMSGNDATQEIRKFNKSIPIIALTAADIEELRHNYKTIGFNDIITKPFDNYDFFQIIATHIQDSKAREANPSYL